MENDLIRRSAVIDAIRGEREYLIARKQLGAEHILAKHADAVIDSIPAVDAVPVVRCRECSRRYAKDFGQYCPTRVGPVRPDGYCDEGQRGEEGGA